MISKGSRTIEIEEAEEYSRHRQETQRNLNEELDKTLEQSEFEGLALSKAAAESMGGVDRYTDIPSAPKEPDLTT